MTRRNRRAELWSEVSRALLVRDPASPSGSTTLDAAASAGDTTLSVSDETGFSSGDLIRIDTEANMEEAEVDSVTTGQLTLVSPIAFDHDSDVDVVTREEVDLGDITEDGATPEFAHEKDEVRAATRRTAIGWIDTFVGYAVGFDLRYHSIENVAAMFGIPEGNINGSGTSSDPYVLDVTASDVNTLADHSIAFEGVLKNGETFRIELWGMNVQADQSIDYLKGEGTVVPIMADGHHVRFIGPTP